MILSFYLFCLAILVPTLSLSLIKGKKEVVKRASVLILLAHIFPAVLWGGEVAFFVFTIMVAGVGVYEFSRLYYGVKGRLMSIAACLALVMGCVFVWNSAFAQYLALPALALAVFSFLPDNRLVASKLYHLLFSGLIITLGAVSLIKIYEAKPELIIVFLLIIQFNDAFAFLAGKKFGKTKIFPNVSPNKTLEGYLGGAAGILLSILILHTLIPVLKGGSLGADALSALFFLVFANWGDLLFSRVKRGLGVKDFSELLPGHGGMLDRFDNFLFAAPVFWIFSLRFLL